MKFERSVRSNIGLNLNNKLNARVDSVQEAYNMCYQYVESEPFMWNEHIVSINSDLYPTLCRHLRTGSNSVFQYNMLNRITQPLQ